MPALQRDKPLALYYQLAEELRRQIHVGHLAPHTVIASEPELVASYHVSRATVRQAISELVKEGLLYRIHGKGTFVSGLPMQQPASELHSLSTELTRQGKLPGGIFIARELTRGSDDVREHLKLALEEQVLLIERVRTADGQPCAYEIDYLPYPRASEISRRAKEVAEGSLYRALLAEGLTPALATQSITGGVLPANAAALLQLSMDALVLHVICTTYDPTGAPILYTELFCRSDRMTFEVTLPVARPI